MRKMRFTIEGDMVIRGYILEKDSNYNITIMSIDGYVVGPLTVLEIDAENGIKKLNVKKRDNWVSIGFMGDTQVVRIQYQKGDSYDIYGSAGDYSIITENHFKSMLDVHRAKNCYIGVTITRNSDGVSFKREVFHPYPMKHI